MNAAAQLNNDAQISSLDSFVAGLAPTFWAHIPLLIGHIKTHLHLIDGIQCFLMNVKRHHCHHEELDGYNIFSSQLLSSSFPDAQKIIPISKCHLVGTIVNAERKSHGSNMYILDDGTGLIDILHYSDGDLYSLPSLTGNQVDNIGSNHFEPGDMVRIFGRIQCRVATLPSESNNDGALDGNKIRHFIPASNVTREILASLIVPLSTASIYRSRARPNSIDHECEHWKDCAKFLRTGSLNDNSNTSELPLLNNAKDVLPLLGSDLVNQVIERNSVISSHSIDDPCDDMAQAWRIFGTQCQCTNTALKRDLLYCHCTATRLDNATIDPNLVYRDALLNNLLEAEALFASSLPPPKSVNEIWNDIINEVENEQNCHHFHFQYRTITTDDRLNQIAYEEIKRSSMNDSTSRNNGSGGNVNESNPINFRNVQELIRGTVRALRKDGILYLIDAGTDTYLLISRTGVLEPYIRTKLALQKLSAERRTRYDEAASRFPYIKSVPRSRLEFVRRRVIASMKCD